MFERTTTAMRADSVAVNRAAHRLAHDLLARVAGRGTRNAALRRLRRDIPCEVPAPSPLDGAIGSDATSDLSRTPPTFQDSLTTRSADVRGTRMPMCSDHNERSDR